MSKYNLREGICSRNLEKLGRATNTIEYAVHYQKPTLRRQRLLAASLFERLDGRQLLDNLTRACRRRRNCVHRTTRESPVQSSRCGSNRSTARRNSRSIFIPAAENMNVINSRQVIDLLQRNVAFWVRATIYTYLHLPSIAY